MGQIQKAREAQRKQQYADCLHHLQDARQGGPLDSDDEMEIKALESTCRNAGKPPPSAPVPLVADGVAPTGEWVSSGTFLGQNANGDRVAIQPHPNGYALHRYHRATLITDGIGLVEGNRFFVAYGAKDSTIAVNVLTVDRSNPNNLTSRYLNNADDPHVGTMRLKRLGVISGGDTFHGNYDVTGTNPSNAGAIGEYKMQIRRHPNLATAYVSVMTFEGGEYGVSDNIRGIGFESGGVLVLATIVRAQTDRRSAGQTVAYTDRSGMAAGSYEIGSALVGTSLVEANIPISGTETLSRAASSGDPAGVDPRPQLAPDVSWTGQFDSTGGPLSLLESDETIIGIYTWTDGTLGRLQGRATGSNRLEFGWTEAGGRTGRGVFTLSADGARFEGTWGNGAETASGGSWTGTRSSNVPQKFVTPGKSWLAPVLKRSQNPGPAAPTR